MTAVDISYYVGGDVCSRDECGLAEEKNRAVLFVLIVRRLLSIYLVMLVMMSVLELTVA